MNRWMDYGWVDGWTDPLLVTPPPLDQWLWGSGKSWWQKLAQEERRVTWFPDFVGHPEIKPAIPWACSYSEK